MDSAWADREREGLVNYPLVRWNDYFERSSTPTNHLLIGCTSFAVHCIEVFTVLKQSFYPSTPGCLITVIPLYTHFYLVCVGNGLIWSRMLLPLLMRCTTRCFLIKITNRLSPVSFLTLIYSMHACRLPLYHNMVVLLLMPEVPPSPTH